MKKITSKFMALLLSLLTIVGTMTTPAFAAEDLTPGEPGSPFGCSSVRTRQGWQREPYPIRRTQRPSGNVSRVGTQKRDTMRENIKRLTLRLNAQEYAHLQRLAQVSGMKMEPLIRQLILGVELRPRPPDEYAALLRELSAIGNNVNQIAYWANSCRSISEQDIQEAAALVKQACPIVY